MEVYYQSNSLLKFYVYNNSILTNADLGVDSVHVTITKFSDGTSILTDFLATNFATGSYSVSLSTFTNDLGKYKAVWTYKISGTTFTSTSFYDVVVGYTTPADIRLRHPDLASKTDDELFLKEKIARNIINIYCGQTFDFQLQDTLKLRGQDKEVLSIPRRLYNLTSVLIENIEDVTAAIELTNNYTLSWIPFTVIENRRFTSRFKKSTMYAVKGDYGWPYVPEEIKMAAELLIGDYFSDQTLLQAHGIIRTRAGDTEAWFDRSFLMTGTGNYEVDVLLSPYSLSGMTLI